MFLMTVGHKTISANCFACAVQAAALLLQSLLSELSLAAFVGAVEIQQKLKKTCSTPSCEPIKRYEQVFKTNTVS